MGVRLSESYGRWRSDKEKLIAESRRKTDKIDAKILCDLLWLDGLPTPVHMPARDSRELRGLLAILAGAVISLSKITGGIVTLPAPTPILAKRR